MQVIKQPDRMMEVNTLLPVMEHFYTIQGEGVNTGKAAYFIRFAGCDVGCVWCDVKESWSKEGYPLMKNDDICNLILQHGANMAVITGGEPLMYNLDELTSLLHANGVTTCLETSGAYPLSGTWDWICVSPKKFKAPIPAVINAANELKVVVYNKSDFEWAEVHALSANEKCSLLLQPEYGRFDEMIPVIIDYVKKNPKWRISLQTHKIINVP